MAEKEGLNIPLHTTFYCFIKLLVNHAFTSFKPPFLFHVSQAYIYNSALSCTIRVRQIRRSHSISSPHVLPLVGRGASRCSMSLICWNVHDAVLSPECLCLHWRAGKLLVGLFKGRVTDRTLTAADIHIIIELRHSFLTAFVMF